MAFQSVDNTAEAVVRFSANLQIMTMTFYFFHTGGYNLTDLEQLADDMDAWAVAEFKPLLSTSAAYTGVNVRGLEFVNDQEAFNDDGAGFGATAAAPCANFQCLAVKRSSIFTGRSARGRVYFPVNLAHIDTNEDFIAAAAATAIEDALNEVRVVPFTHSWAEVIVSRYTAGVKRTAGAVFAVVNYSATDLEFDTQRRRMGNK